MLFSSSITKETEIIFKSFDGLNDARQSLINSRLYKSLGVIYLNEKKKLGYKKRKWFWTPKHGIKTFSFGFMAKNNLDIFKCYFMFLDYKGNNIEFTKGEDKIPILNFKIQTTKWIKKMKCSDSSQMILNN